MYIYSFIRYHIVIVFVLFYNFKYVYWLPDGHEQEGAVILFPAHVPQLVDVVVQVVH